jgi:hypothetical protein
MNPTAYRARRIAIARAAPVDSPADVARPFVWIAAIAFTAGFWGYLALAPLFAR